MEKRERCVIMFDHGLTYGSIADTPRGYETAAVVYIRQSPRGAFSFIIQFVRRAAMHL